MKGWFDIAGAAAWCSTGKRTLEMWIKEEGLRCSRIRGKRLIKKDWLNEFLEQHELGSGNEVNRIVSDVCKEMGL
jgi:excisionase family DNA binding protein